MEDYSPQSLLGGQQAPISEFDNGNSGAGTVTLDWNKGNRQKITLTGNCTFAAPSNLKAGATYILRLIGDGTVRVPTWNAVFVWPGAVAPNLGAGSDVNIFAFYCDGTNLYGSHNRLQGPRVTSIASGATWSPNSNTTDLFIVTAQAAAVTAIDNPTGSPVDGQKLMMRVKDNGTARAISGWGTQYRFSSDLAAPTTTIISKTLYMGFIFNSADTKWDMIALLNNF